jgi:O-antigen/teichoic acid export membrane protein
VLSKVKNESLRYKTIVLNLLALISLYAFFLVGLVYVLAEEIVVVLLSDKWIESVPYLELLVISGFSAPIGALLLNVLRSRGRAREFLRSEVYKKAIRGLCMIVGFNWGIEGFLYGMIVASITGTCINIAYARKELDISASALGRTVLVQAALAATSVGLVLLSSGVANPDFVSGVLLKLLVFCAAFLGMNHILRTQAYLEMRRQLSELRGRQFV